jgi:hypothetical protein
LVPLGVALVLKMVPKPVMTECREKAREVMGQGKPTNWVAAGIIVAIWLLLAGTVIVLMIRVVKG